MLMNCLITGMRRNMSELETREDEEAAREACVKRGLEGAATCEGGINPIKS